nr:MAG TPA: hypothetical protein [Caudoviricetes sp.]
MPYLPLISEKLYFHLIPDFHFLIHFLRNYENTVITNGQRV